jgi:hypothetical protein
VFVTCDSSNTSIYYLVKIQIPVLTTVSLFGHRKKSNRRLEKLHYIKTNFIISIFSMKRFIIRVNKPRGMKCDVTKIAWKERNAYERLVGQHERKTSLGVPSYKRKFKLKIIKK